MLLSVSGTIPDDLDHQVLAGLRPRADYRVLAEQLQADVIDVTAARRHCRFAGRVLGKIAGGAVLLAWYAFRQRRRYEVILTDGEQVGIPLALLTRVLGSGGSKHAMIVHILSTPPKQRLIRLARLADQVDRYLVYCGAQRRFIVEHLGVAPSRVIETTFMVDSEFFAPDRVHIARRRMICSAGLERRDYVTLLAAIDGLDVEVVVAAASPWSKQPDTLAGVPVPPNVSVTRLGLAELRELYQASQFVVMPLLNVDFQAGITTILEAMSMGRAVVCTRTPGQVDTITEGVTGRYVGIGDVAGLRSVIVELLDDPEQADRLGATAREWILANADIERYADRLSGIVSQLRRPAR